MAISDMIQGGILLSALLTLIFQQKKQNNDISRAENRLENKLKIFFLCQEDERTEQEIIQYFKGMDPSKSVNETEVKKTIYEMLKDETLRYRTNNTFRARRNTAKEQGDEKM